MEMQTSRDLQDVLPHIFLPRKLPQATIPKELEHLESVILTLLSYNFEKFVRTIENDSVSIKQSLQLFKTWTSIQGKTKLEHIRITEAICSLENGQSMALYVRAQNAGLIISFPDEGSDHVIISTFPASLKSEIVLASERTEMIASMYPALSVQVPRSNLLLSETLGEQLKDLCLNICEIAMPTTIKAGKDNIEVRDVPDSMLISKWLPCTLSNSDSKICSAQDFPSIPKKVRDDVIWKDTLLPFRRSGMYMTIKVVLHLSLVKEFGEILGTFIYKSVMIQFMTYFCHTLNDMDLGIQIISKISRRMYKLNQYFILHDSILYGNPYLHKYNEFRQTNTDILQKTRVRLNQIWKKIIQVDSVQSLVNISSLEDFKSDTKHLLNHSKCYFKKEEQVATNVKFQPGSQCPLRHRSTENFLPLDTLSLTDEVNCGIQLHDFENWVQYHFENIPYSTTYASSVRELFMKYFEIGKNYYKSDPVGYSRLVITCIKIVQVFDQMVIKIDKQKIFHEHRTGVEWSCISNLLLPSRQDMKMAHDLEKYFMNRDKVAIYPSLIEDQNVSNKSYSVRYAKNNYEMGLLRNKIITHGENMIASKKDELRSTRIRCEELRDQVSRKSHEYFTGSWNNSIHASNCKKCNLERAANNCVAYIYEKPLPEEDYKQLAVVFELIIPSEIACLRDIIFILASKVCTENWESKESKTCFYLWAHSSQLSSYVINLRPDFVHLGSTLISYIKSHYGRCAKHVDNDDSEFVVNNAYNTRYGSEESLLQSSYGEIVKSICTFQIQPNSQYSNLQWMLRSTKHSQNEVLSRQVDCSPELSLEEFKVFGSLRAGHRLQWRNIYSALSQGSLTFKTESVFTLICQSIWEAGPTGIPLYSFCRDSHQDLNDSNFVSVLLELLEEKLKSNSKNWNDPLVLFTFTFITVRILIISDDLNIKRSGAVLLKKCRVIANEWVVKIKDLLGKMTQAPHEEVTNLRNKLIECAACSALTFSVDYDCFNTNENDVMNWFQAIAWIDENVVINFTASNENMSILLRNILRWVRTSALSLEPRLHEILFRTNKKHLTSFVMNHWAGAIYKRPEEWRPVESPCEQVYFSEWTQEGQKSLIVEFDIVLGCFLVNGAPIGRLPKNITKHQDFVRIFQQSIFEVHTEGPGIYVTAAKTNNVNYKFFTGENDRLFIVELHDNKELHLFPHTFFKNDIPPLLIENYSHWWRWNKIENIIDFRPKLYNDKKFYSWDKMEYQLELKSNTLLDVRSQTTKTFVDTSSSSFSKIVKVMERLEHPDFIHLIYCDSNKEITIELPRMMLQFEIKKPNHILSKEYPNMRVSEDQKFGTLIGLKQRLLLKSIDFEDDWLIIVPHGKLSIGPDNSGHVNVNIDHFVLLDPPFFVYEVDHRLQQLKAGQNHLGWLYLSYLHAASASPLQDPFTGLTGTEKAMKILQSGHCWSFEPMKNEAISILKEISKLSPTRKYYPEHLQCMQTIEWPHGLASVAAEDAYILLTDKLISDSRRLNFLFQNEKVSENKHEYEHEHELNFRAYKRNSVYCGEEARISPGFDKILNILLKSKEGTGFPINLEDSIMINVRQLAHLGHNWTNSKSNSPVLHFLEELLLSTGNIQGISFEGFIQHDRVTNWLGIDFQNTWLNLYNFARIIKEKTHLQSMWTMLLCILAFNKTSIDHLLILHTVALHPSSFKDPPPYYSYLDTNENDFDCNKITSIFKYSAKDLEAYLEEVKRERYHQETDSKFSNRMESRLNGLVNDQVEKLTIILKKSWPIESCNRVLFHSVSHPQINISCAIEKINQNLQKWFHNYELRIFLEEVAATVTKLTSPIRQNEGVPKNEIKQTQFVTQFTKFLQKTRLNLKFDNFLNSEEIVLIDPTNTDAADIFKCGQELKVTDVVSSCDESLSLPPYNQLPLFPFHQNLACPVESYYNCSIKKSWDIYHGNLRTMKLLNCNIQTSVEAFIELREHYRKRAASLRKEIQNIVYQNDTTPEFHALYAGGHFPRLTPVVFIPLLCQPDTQDNETYTQIRNLIGALCVIWTLEQRVIRCLRYKHGGVGLEVALSKEISNPGHLNWSPVEYPKWLILELEMDMMVRPIQIKVAKKMLNPPDNKNALMQLNMGEGKTAVIIPLLVVAMANGNQLCRVTVLRSLYQINLRRLILNLGGLLNQRVYSFPCRRDMKIDGPEAQQMLELHKECMEKSGVVLTRPEHRLSLQLKSYEKCRASNFSDAEVFLKLHQWMRENVRDVLDESDEILQVKYQLIYTVGEQQQLDGGSLRWTIVQDIFKILQFHLPKIYEKFGKNSTEFRQNSTHPEEFSHFRLLNATPYPEICELIVNDFIEGKSKSLKTRFPEINSTERSSVLHFLTASRTDPATHEHILNIYKENTNVIEIMLIIRGILAYGILQLALTKRWRVNYGVNPNGDRLMAVPFRAKDVAAEKTEFGHPDVAILFTHLSYYYSGLSDAQIYQCFEYLERSQTPGQEYERWVSNVNNVDPSIQSLSGVNLLDFEQKTNHLYPALKRNTEVINFWLDNVVFPKESKQFPGKMVCTAWDLCSDEGKHPVTGFSGTNDSALLLPLSISQNDLPELHGTNGEVLNNLLLPENNNYTSLEPNSRTISTNILEWITNNNIRVLLDVGALILELTNKEVGKKWLEMVSQDEVDAVVYFDDFDRLVVRDRQGKCSIFETSSFRARLNRCVVYLDDAHTRGTDLKIPSGFKACVTLGTGITKDKLVQGCMRMRMIGKGHTVHFLSSEEVNNSIRVLVSDSDSLEISAQNVLQWAMINSCTITRDNMLYWAAAGINFAQKCSAELIHKQNINFSFDKACLALSDQCTDKEVIELKKYYGGCRREETIPGIAQLHLRKVLEELMSKLGEDTNNLQVVDSVFNKIGNEVMKKCNEFVPNVKIFAQLLEEEQERELEQELQEERQVSRPGQATPHEHNLTEPVKNFLTIGSLTNQYEWCVKLPDALNNTIVASMLQKNAWGDNIFATQDFVHVIEVQNQKDGVGEFLRTPTWIAVLTTDSIDENERPEIKTLLLLSPYEANEMIPLFRLGNMITTLNMFTAKLRPKHDILLTNMELAIPSKKNYKIWQNLSNFYAHLSLFAGTLYFTNKEEEEYFCKLYGYIPRPRSKAEQYAFDNGWTSNGFIKPEYRQNVRGGEDLCKFQSNPDELIRKIIIMRHGFFETLSHVSVITLESRKCFD